jgi:hypothetical protein
MKFGDQYELLESLTTGGVETFVANDKVRGERVLVHILHCDPQKPNQPTVQWVLESFRHVAPEPVGLVLETGRYSGTLYAYLVTKLPDEAALHRWVQQYETQSRDTQEFPMPPAKPTPESEAPTAEHNSKEPPQVPGPITQLFREFEPKLKSAVPNARPQEKETEQPSLPVPNFSPSADRSGVRPAPPWDPEAPQIPVRSKTEPNVSSPSVLLRPDFTAKTFPSEPSTPAMNGPKPGEFTSFFQGPFRGDRPSETPAVSPPPEPPRKTVGDFTAVFGPLKPQPEESLPASGIAGNEPSGTGFTGWFNPDIPLRTTSSTTAPPASTGLPRATVDPTPVPPAPPKEAYVPLPPVAYVAPAPPVFPTPVPLNPPMPNAPAVAQSALPSDGATRAFARPNIEPAPGPPAPPSGPSAYTQVISLRAPNPSADVAGAQKQAPLKELSLPAFPAPAKPPLPSMAPPPLPAIALPAPPPPPKLAKGAIPEPAVSYWPLILTLTVLFFVAVLLVLYFVLKH